MDEHERVPTSSELVMAAAAASGTDMEAVSSDGADGGRRADGGADTATGADAGALSAAAATEEGCRVGVLEESPSSSSNKLTLLPLCALIFYEVSGGPYGIEVGRTSMKDGCLWGLPTTSAVGWRLLAV